MSSALLEGSNIKIDSSNGHQLIVVPHGSGGVLKYFLGAFLLFWLGLWFMGFASTSSLILSGGGNAFAIFWLGAWSIGGLFVVYSIYRIFRRSIPECILLNRPSLSVDTGIPPLKITSVFGSQKEYWKLMFFKRKRIEFTPLELKTMALRETDTGNRLTIDKGAKRFELAVSASEIEREWLYGYLKKNYVV